MEKAKLFVFSVDEMAKLGIIDEGVEEVKCPSCNWKTTSLYVLAKDKEEAVNMLKDGGAGMCGACMSEMIAEEKWSIC